MLEIVRLEALIKLIPLVVSKDLVNPAADDRILFEDVTVEGSINVSAILFETTAFVEVATRILSLMVSSSGDKTVF